MNGKHGPKQGWNKPGTSYSLTGNREARAQSDKLDFCRNSAQDPQVRGRRNRGD